MALRLCGENQSLPRIPQNSSKLTGNFLTHSVLYWLRQLSLADPATTVDSSHILPTPGCVFRSICHRRESRPIARPGQSSAGAYSGCVSAYATACRTPRADARTPRLHHCPPHHPSLTQRPNLRRLT